MSRIQTASEHSPCQHCGGDSWCWTLESGDSGCYRLQEGGEPKQDSRGEPYRLFRKEPRTKAEGRATPDLVYEYVDPDGNPVLKVERWEPSDTHKKKRHKQFTWRGNAWVPVGMTKTPLLFADRLKNADKTRPVFILEGEKKAGYGASGGLLTTSSPMGACSFNRVDPVYLELLRDRKVIILPDNDGEGFRHARQIAETLKSYTPHIHLLEIPGLPAKGDLVDYLQAGGTTKSVLNMAEHAPTFEEWQAKQGIVLDSPTDFDLPTVTGLALAALVASNNPAILFVYGGRLARIIQGEHGAEIEPLEVDAARGVMARANPWKVIRAKRGEVPFPPPSTVVKDVLTQPRYPAALPILEGILRVPVFSRGGELANQPGYNACANMWLDLPKNLNIPPIPDNPTAQHLARAREILLEPICDFPFADRASRVHAVAAAITPFGRKLIRGPVPLFAVTSPSIGTGKSLLSTAIAWGVTGQDAGSLSWTADEDELRKRITSILREGHAFAVLDNVPGKVDSATLASILTAEWFLDRLLSTNSMLRLRNEAVWMFSANNPELSAEIARRALLIRLDAMTSKPWLRSGFRHANLKAFLSETRAMLVWSALVAWKAWLVAGRPLYSTRKLGSFECWCEVVGGVLGVLGLEGLLENYDQLWSKTEGELAPWEAFVSHWWAIKGESEQFSGDLFKMATANELLTQLYASSKSERAALTAFGMGLSRCVDRVFGDFRIERVRVDRCGRAVYKLSSIANIDYLAEPAKKVCASLCTPETAPLSENADLLNLADLF